MLDTLYRRSLLGVAEAPPVERLIRRLGWRLGVRRFVAGETTEEAIVALREVEAKNRHGILDLLGEFVDTPEGAEAMTREILTGLDALAGSGLDPYMSVKPTQLGLGSDPTLARANAERVLERAAEISARICFDMENSPHVDATLDLVRDLREAGHRQLSTVLQSYLKRTPDDLATLLELDSPPAVRIVKGAYREPPALAYQAKADVDRAFRELVLRGLEAGAKIDIATHDETIIDETAAFVRGRGLGSDRYEFQLLYGVKPALQERLTREGHPVRIYIPYGVDWYGYFSRRLAERPANLAFVVRGLFG